MIKLSWKLQNAQETADEFPYTFHKPSKEVVSQLKIGNQAKVIFEFDSEEPDAPSAERMWVEITDVNGQDFLGYLDNDPSHIKDLKYKDPIAFHERHIIDTDLKDPIPSITEEFIKRCFVTNNILDEGQNVGYFYREEPDDENDSGWRFNTATETDEYMDDANNISYVSLGAVLRNDDSFVHLLKSEVGLAFAKDEAGNFVELD